MAVESLIKYRSDASEVKRDIAVLKQAKAAAEQIGQAYGGKINATALAKAQIAANAKVEAAKLAAGSKVEAVQIASTGRLAEARQKADAQAALAHQKAVIGIVERRQKAEIAADAQISASRSRVIAAQQANETAVSKAREARETRSTRRVASESRRAATSASKSPGVFETIKNQFAGFNDIKEGIESIYKVAAKVVSVIWDAGKAVVDAQAFKEDVREALTVVTGSAEQSKAIMDQAAKTADLLGKKRAEVSGVMLDLATKGFDPALSDRIVRSVADLGAIDPKASLEGVIKVLGKAQAQGRLNLDILSELNTFGLEQGDVIRQIGKMLGKNDKEVLRLLSSQGGIRDLGVEPILRAINAQVGGGEAGAAAMAKARRNLSSLLEQVKDIPANILFDLDVGPATDKLKTVLREILDFFSSTSATGKDVRQVTADIVTAFAEGLFGVDVSKGSIKDVLKDILETVRASKGDVKAFAQGIASIGSAIAWFTGIIGKVSEARQAIAEFFGFQPPGGIFGAAFFGALMAPLAAIKSLVPEFYQAGEDLIKGLVDGIVGGAASVWAAAKGAAQSALDAVKGVFQSHSPAKATMVEGVNFDSGLAKGMTANDNARKAAAEISRGAIDTTRAGLGAAVGGGRGGTVIHASFAPRYTVSGLDAKQAEDLKRLQADEWAKWEAFWNRKNTEEAMAG